MAHIVILTHAHDSFRAGNYLLRSFICHWMGAGHRVSLVAGLRDCPDGDIAILHVDLSVIPASYVEASKRYPVVLNGAALDIRKRLVSRSLLRPEDDWDGPVIVKTDLNCGGHPELRIQQNSARAGSRADIFGEGITSLRGPYPIFRTVKDVPDAVWDDPGLVVERFLPERDARGFWMRAWVFLGEKERCTRYLGSHPVVKSGNILAREPAPVPDALRAERRRLGFDFGKFDFVVRDGEAILFDANRTPWAPPPPLTPQLQASNASLAHGLDAWLRT